MCVRTPGRDPINKYKEHNLIEENNKFVWTLLIKLVDLGLELFYTKNNIFIKNQLNKRTRDLNRWSKPPIMQHKI